MKTKTVILFTFLFYTLTVAYSQDKISNEESIKKACLNYIEGFYEGDTLKIQDAIIPELYKHGYWKNENGGYESEGLMSYEDAIKYAKNVFEKKKFASSKAPKEVKILSISTKIACAKITAWWGIDFVLLSKGTDENWLIEQVLWEGPLTKSN